MSDQTNNSYNKDLKQLARNLRKVPTQAEDFLWQDVLRNRKMLGQKFTRQRPVLNYIADFMCQTLKLIIEVDGLTHQYDHAKDLQRDAELIAQ